MLVHELAHLRQHLSRPRFLLGRPDGAADADERAAAALTSLVRPGVGTAGAGRPTSTAGRVQDLPVAPGAGAGLVELVRTTARESVADGLGPAGLARHEVAPAAPAGPAGPAGGAGIPVGAPSAAPTVAPTAAGLPSAPGAPAAAAASGAGVAAGGPAATLLTDEVVDGLVDALERRLVAELERRGGRYTGVF